MGYQAKRKYKRAVYTDGVKLETGNGVEFATYEDVSFGGLRLYLDHDVKAGAIMQASFTVRHGGIDKIRSEIRVLGKVVRCIKSISGYTVGLQFLNLTKETRENLASLVEVDIEAGPF